MIQSRQSLLDEHKRASSRIGIRESRYYTFPVRLLQSFYDFDGSLVNASDMTPAEVYSALDIKLQVLSLQRENFSRGHALTNTNYTIEELFGEINVLQKALNVLHTGPSAPVESIPYRKNLGFEKDMRAMLTQLQVLTGTHLSFAWDDTDRSAASPTRSYTVVELTHDINELNVLTERAFDDSAAGLAPIVNPQTAQPYTVDQLNQRARDLQQGKVHQAVSRPLKPSSEKGNDPKP